MDDLCDSELDLDKYDSVRLKLTANSWSKNIDCYLRVKTNSNNRMMFYFKVNFRWYNIAWLHKMHNIKA